MSDIKKLIKNFSSSAISSITGQAIGFFTLLYLPRVLGANGYGIFNFAQSYAMYFLLFCDLGLSLYCVRESNQNENKKEIIDKVYNLKFYLSIISTTVFILSLLILKVKISEKIILSCMSLSVFFTGITIDYLFNTYSNMKYVGISVAIKNIVFFILSVIFIKHNNEVFLTVLFYNISIIIIVIYLYLRFSRLYFKPKLHWIKFEDFKILKKSLPLAISLFMVQINNNFDIIYLSFTKTHEEVGYYSVAYKIINFLIAIMCIYLNAAYPVIAELFKNGKDELSKYIDKFYEIGIVFVTPIVFGGIALNNKIIDFLFGYQYSEAQVLFLLLIPLVFIRMVTSTYGAVLIMGDGSKEFSIGVIIGAIINIFLNVVLVPNYGAKGSAIATLLCESIQGIYLYYHYKKYCDSKFLKISVIPIISSLIMYIVLNLSNKMNLFFSIGIGIIVYLSVFIPVYYMINPYKRKNFLKYLRVKFNLIK